MKYLIMFTSLFFLYGCDNLKINDSKELYKFHNTSDGKTLRINIEDGSVSEVTKDGLKFMPDNRTITLKINKIYNNEHGESIMYKGDNKFTTDTSEIANVLIKKYAD